MTDATGSTPAGWHADPGGSGQLRWWDGHAWTAHLAPQPTPTPAPTPQPSPTPVVQAPAALPPVAQPAAYSSSQAILQPDGQPYVPFQNTWNSAQYTPSTADYARPAQWNTVGGWLLGFSSLVTGIVGGLGAAIVLGVGGTTASILQGSALSIGVGVGTFVVSLLLLLFFADADRRVLRTYGYVRTPSILWNLLSPLIYLILRTIAVTREVRRGWGPLVAYLVIAVIGIAASVAVPLFLASRVAAPDSGVFTSSLQRGLDANGGDYRVSCPAVIPSAIGATFSCTATDASTNASHVLHIEVVDGTDGKPTVKLLSVDPPITN